MQIITRGHVDVTDERLESISQAIKGSANTTQLETLDKTINNLNGKLDGLKDAITSTANANTTHIQALNTTIGTLNGSVNSLKTEIKCLKDSVNEYMKKASSATIK
jgi:chromosome segregation ATPase